MLSEIRYIAHCATDAAWNVGSSVRFCQCERQKWRKKKEGKKQRSTEDGGTLEKVFPFKIVKWYTEISIFIYININIYITLNGYGQRKKKRKKKLSFTKLKCFARKCASPGSRGEEWYAHYCLPIISIFV